MGFRSDRIRRKFDAGYLSDGCITHTNWYVCLFETLRTGFFQSQFPIVGRFGGANAFPTTTTRPVVLHTFCWSGVPNRLTVSRDIHDCRGGEVRGHIAHARSASDECGETVQDRVSVRERSWSRATDGSAARSAVRRNLPPLRSIQYHP